jgi:hypothetical protein
MYSNLENTQPIRIFQRKAENARNEVTHYLLYVSMLSNNQEFENSKGVIERLKELMEKLAGPVFLYCSNIST